MIKILRGDHWPEIRMLSCVQRILCVCVYMSVYSQGHIIWYTEAPLSSRRFCAYTIIGRVVSERWWNTPLRDLWEHRQQYHGHGYCTVRQAAGPAREVLRGSGLRVHVRGILTIYVTYARLLYPVKISAAHNQLLEPLF